MMGLRLKKGVSEEEYFKRFDQPFPQKIKDCFFEWKKKNLAELSIENKWINFSLNEDGMLFLNRLLEQIS